MRLDNPQVARRKADHPAVAVHLAPNATMANADYSALWSRFAMEAVEQQKFNSIPHLEGATPSHRFGFGLGMMLPLISPTSTRRDSRKRAAHEKKAG